MYHDELIERRIAALLADMSLAEKIGQLSLRNASEGYAPDYLADDIRAGLVGGVLNVVDPAAVSELQRIAVRESRLGIPLLVGRDVIHGFRTIFPIPLGLAATWDPGLVRESAMVAANEAAAVGVNWTFAPMIDIARDPRWGRIAESFGEDVFLAVKMTEAMVIGFQGHGGPGTLGACAKHFAGYGAAESGRDYATTSIPEVELRNVYLPPFKAALEAGVLSFMPSFSELNGIPASANEFLLRQVLRQEWGFDGLVVSDWDSISQLQVHGLTKDDRGSALAAFAAGVDMEMAGRLYLEQLESLVEEGQVTIAMIDRAVANVLRSKFRLGLFAAPEESRESPAPLPHARALELARLAALKSVVLLENRDALLPLRAHEITSVAVIGPLADAPREQLGTWVFDGDPDMAVTPLRAIEAMLGPDVELRYIRAMEHSRSRAGPAFDHAAEMAGESDVAILFLGEEAILSGEAHCRADIGLPGDQLELLRRVRATGTRVVAVVMAGRPLTLPEVVEHTDALLFAWHPGTMGGPAIADLLFGRESPSGKLPATFPRMVGQVPIYYCQKNTGKPPSPDHVIHIDDIEVGAAQTSLGMTAFHLDAGYEPLFPFGFGLSYARFRYDRIAISATEIPLDGLVSISAEVKNVGDVPADEVVQLYVRDLVGSVTRPVRELKGFRRLRLAPGETARVVFELHTDDLAFHGRDMRLGAEPGEFQAWIGGDSRASLGTAFRVVTG